MKSYFKPHLLLILVFLTYSSSFGQNQSYLGTPPPKGAKVYLDGSNESLQQNWTYWNGPRLAATPPLKWPEVIDPVDGKKAISSNDPAGAGGKYGAADIVTKDEFRDFEAHVEFLILKEGGNSGVYLQNRYEIQVLDGDYSLHGMAAVINEALPTSQVYNGLGKWNAYDIKFQAAKFTEGKLVQKANVTIYFNGVKIHDQVSIQQVWGGPNSGIDGGNEGGKGITDTPGGLKLQAEGHDVLYRNIWIKPLN